MYAWLIKMRWTMFLLVSPVLSQTCGELRVAYQNTGCCTGGDCSLSIPNCEDADPGKVCYDGTDIVVKGLLDALGFEESQLTLKKHLIPDTPFAYNLGNPEYKLNYIFYNN